MKKTFILDTNVLLHDPKALFAFGDNDVVVPIYVIEEIDKFKRDLSELGRNARQVSRILDAYRSRGNLGEGVQTEKGGILSVLFTERNLPKEMANGAETDNRILAVALDVRDSDPDRVTHLRHQGHQPPHPGRRPGPHRRGLRLERVEISELYTGFAELEVAGGMIDAFYTSSVVELPARAHLPNQFVLP